MLQVSHVNLHSTIKSTVVSIFRAPRGLNQVFACLTAFKPIEWQKQIFAGKNPTP